MTTLPPEYYEQAKQDLEKLAVMTCPFGKYAGRRIIDLSENYLLWFRQKGFPSGELGRFMQIALEMKVNGCDQLLRMPRNAESPPRKEIRLTELRKR